MYNMGCIMELLLLVLLGLALFVYIRKSKPRNLSAKEIIDSRIKQAKNMNLSKDVWFLAEHFIREAGESMHPSDKSVAEESGFHIEPSINGADSYSADALVNGCKLTFIVSKTKKGYLPDSSYEYKTVEIFNERECVLSFRVDLDRCPYTGISSWRANDTVDGYIPGSWESNIKRTASKARGVYERLSKEYESKKNNKEEEAKKKRFGIK